MEKRFLGRGYEKQKYDHGSKMKEIESPRKDGVKF